MGTAVERWETLLNSRARQMDAAYARLGRTSADFWDRRARRFHSITKDSIARDPLFQRLKRVVTAETSVLDVGAGTGRGIAGELAGADLRGNGLSGRQPRPGRLHRLPRSSLSRQ